MFNIVSYIQSFFSNQMCENCCKKKRKTIDIPIYNDFESSNEYISSEDITLCMKCVMILASEKNLLISFKGCTLMTMIKYKAGQVRIDADIMEEMQNVLSKENDLMMHQMRNIKVSPRISNNVMN